MWLLRDAGATEWAEIGLIDGWNADIGSAAYGNFYGYFDYTGQFHYAYLSTFSPGPYTGSYQISRAAEVNSCLYFWNGVQRVIVGSNWWTGVQAVQGGEFATPQVASPPFPHADTFNMSGQVVNADGQLVTFPNGPAQIHDGFNGVSYSQGEWSWNAP